ncbi:MAG: enoyl-CoA hydratase/isomerase family protein [Chloroflexi bacterium]|nr:MAG: enoyl-CoA hydratase/isomerase family protein [Chloroflexota bacterium]
MTPNKIITEKQGEIGFLTLNYPERGNVLNEELFHGISRTLEELNVDDEVRLIIIKGAGNNFCMGGDVARIATLDESEARNFFLGLVEMYKTFHKIDKPSIAMVQGYATGGGMGVALSCDLIVASEDARFGSTAINAGLFCLNTSGVMLPRIVGSKKALEMGLTGDLISAQEAKRLGFVNKVVPKEMLEPATMALAQKILSKNPVAIVMGRRNFYDCADMEYDKGLEHSAEIFALLATTDEAKRRMKAFLKRRQPSSKQSTSK